MMVSYQPLDGSETRNLLSQGWDVRADTWLAKMGPHTDI